MEALAAPAIHRRRAQIYVVLQLACIASLVFSSRSWNHHPAALWLLAAGLLLGGWAMVVMALNSHLSIMPQPRPDSRLITTGPYRYLRHPMYSALLLTCLGLVMTHGLWHRWVIWGLLLLVLCRKLLLEEKLLRQQFGAYADYQRRTWRLFPLLW